MHRKLQLNFLFIYLALFTQDGIYALQKEKICLTSNIIGLGSITHCQGNTSVSNDVRHGTTCMIKCKNSAHLVNISCINGIWTGSCTENENKHIILRKIRSSFLHRVRCFFWSDWECRTKSDSKPPVLSGCSDVNAKAKKMKIYQNVNWKLPKVYVNGALSWQNVYTSPRPPGSMFFEGTTKASHYALDAIGNLGTCNFNINVEVLRCETIQPYIGGYTQCLPANSRIYGTTCRVSCYKGYNLTGPSDFECTENGYWSIEPVPSCQRVVCDKVITTSAQTKVTCTDMNYYGSRCIYSCKDGYGIPEDQPKVIYCKSNGKWSSDQPICKDILPPEWSNCPLETYIQYADRNKDTAKFESTEPEARDNVDGVVTARLFSGPWRGEVVKTGSYISIYLATDRAGNKAKQCHIKTIVRQITCPKLFNKPYTKIVCENGNKYGASCKYECEDGSLLRGPAVVMCEKNDDQSYGFWSWGDFEPYCEIMETCGLRLNPPANGALACDYWFGGKFCQMQCRKGYDVDPAYRMHNMFVCSEQGRWQPGTNIPDCAKVTPVSTASTSVSIHYYFDGNCFNADVQLEIRENFINAFKNSLYSQACEAFLDKCQVENIQVLCGKQTRKRSADMMELQFEIKLISNEPFSQSTLSDFSKRFDINASNTDAFELNLNSSSKLKPLDISQASPELRCPRGFIPSYTTMSCAECQKGTFYDADTKSCMICPKESYQNRSSAEVCFACPIDTTTEFEGSTKIEDCEAACSLGYWSISGISPCIPCDRGTYQDKKGSTECTKCSEGKTTTFAGADKFDIVFFNKTVEGGISINVSLPDIVRDFKLSMWIHLTNVSETYQILQINDGNTDIGIVYHSEIFYLLATCIEMKVESTLRSWNLITLTVYEENIVFEVNNEQKKINEACVAISTNSTFYIGSDFSGKISQLNIWSINALDASISKLGETCKDNKPGDILSWKQFENMDTFSTTYIDVPSECDDVDECLNTTCKFGQCIDMLHDHLCVCDFGFTGSDCDKNIDDCFVNICENNATCIDKIGSYDCLCKDGYKGDYCEITIVNGSWTEWNEWSHCSSSCDVGERTRFRFCNNPPPLNGGRKCRGNSTQVENCVIEPCKSCKHWDAPNNASLICVNETDKDSINCTLTCNEGFDFDSPPRDYYYCGPSTFHLWEFETDDNPTKRVPSCNAVKNASAMIVMYEVMYAGLVCSDDQTEQLVKSEMQRLSDVMKKNVRCVLENVCHLDEFQSRHCISEIEKREIPKTPVQLQARISCDPSQYGPDVCEESLIAAVDILNGFSSDGTFHIQINSSKYEVVANSSSVGTDITCPEGNEKVSYYCVPCGKGKYHDGTGCRKCDFGQYQSDHGQIICSKCSRNYTTLGRGSVSINECIDKTPPSFDGSCPENITKFVDIESVETEVSWIDPVSVDNSEDPPIVKLVSGLSPGSMFGTNTSTQVQYIATDESGNNSTCKFYVHIKVRTAEVEISVLPFSDAGTLYLAIFGGSITVAVIVIAVIIGNMVLKRRIVRK